MSLSIVKLAWDSAFFKLDVGRIDVPRSGTWNALELKELIGNSSMDLIYVFVPGTLTEPEDAAVRQVLSKSSGVRYDKRMTFRKRLATSALASQKETIAATRLSGPLLELACASGVYSRFSLDFRLFPFFRPMYQKWLEKDFANGKVFVWPNDVNPQGLATVSVREGRGIIGLVAVAEKSRGKGIASALMRTVDAWLSSQGIYECEVVTQGENLAAQALYRKAGFSCCEQTDVWHVWRKQP